MEEEKQEPFALRTVLSPGQIPSRPPVGWEPCSELEFPSEESEPESFDGLLVGVLEGESSGYLLVG